MIPLESQLPVCRKITKHAGKKAIGRANWNNRLETLKLSSTDDEIAVLPSTLKKHTLKNSPHPEKKEGKQKKRGRTHHVILIFIKLLENHVWHMTIICKHVFLQSYLKE
jgi:hypothetical protein